MQPLEPGVLIAIAVAFTAPESSVDPVAEAHLPTVAAALVAATVLVTFVDELSVTVNAVDDGLAAALPFCRPESIVPEITTVVPDAEVTLPKAVVKLPTPGAPDGLVPLAPLGIPPPWPPPGAAPLGIAPPLAPAPRPPACIEQVALPEEITRTVVAVIAVDDPVTGVPLTMTQSPTASVAVTVWVNFVLAV